ncbi:MAG: secretin N-terminal domain-containing protein, partial [Tepidisphaeraceae bacterium]
DETINGKKVVIRVPRDVPESSLLGILQSALKMKQMALVDAEQAGWKQIVVAQNLAAVARPAGQGGPGGQADASSAVTQVFTLKNVDPGKVLELLRPFLTTPGGNIQTVAGQRIIIVSDYAGVVARLAETISAIDASSTPMETRFIPLRNAEAAQIAPLAMQVLNLRDGSGQPGAAGATVVLMPDERSNQIVILAPATRMQEAIALVGSMDTPLNVQTAVYRLKTISPDRLDKLVKNLIGTRNPRTYQSSADRETGALIVTATSEVHVQIEQMLKDLDVPGTAEQSPIRFYKLKNTKAADVLATIAGLLGEEGVDGFRPDGAPEEGYESRDGRIMQTAPGAMDSTDVSSAPPLAPSSMTPTTPQQPSDVVPDNLTSLQQPQNAQTLGGLPLTASRFASRPSGVYGEETPFGPQQGVTSVRARNATVTADPNTNSIIVIAQPAVQQMYADLIKRLDERRPQVQIECTIVTLDTSNGFQLGVDAINIGGFNSYTTLLLSSFGISEVDPDTGDLAPVDGQGGTFALLSPSNVSVVMRALATSSRSRLVSAPQLLVNDNGKGTLKSVAQEPFAEILDTNTTQSRTGLGGQKEAGTTIEVEPHISEDDYLQLGYSIELSSFVGAARGDLPPPSQVNRVASNVTIPDGYTIVVGGLSVRNLRTTVDSIPILGQIPILKYLFSNTSKTATDTTLFVFIRPVILREDKFEDLKYLSATKREQAALPDDFPVSQPIAIH